MERHQINYEPTCLVMMAKITENYYYFTVHQFWSIRPDQSEMEDLVFSKWVQTIVKKKKGQSGRFRIKNQCY